MTIRERNGKYQAIVRIKRHGVLVLNEAQTFDTEALARDWKRRMQAKARKEGPAAVVAGRTTLGDLIDRYRTALAEVKPLRRSMAHELDQMHRYVSGWALSSLTADRFVALARTRRAEGAGPATVMHNLATLRAILNAAHPMFGIDVTGACVAQAIRALERTGHVARPQSRDQRAPDDVLLRFEEEFERVRPFPSTTIHMTPVMWVAVHFPRRRSELCRMRWDDYTGGVIVLHDTKHPRNPRTEVVPVPPAAQEILAKVPRVDERIFPYEPESVSAAWQRAAARLGVAGLTFHSLRHEGVCRLFERGLSIPEVSLVSGHMSWNVLRRYTHLKPEHVLEKLK